MCIHRTWLARSWARPVGETARRSGPGEADAAEFEKVEGMQQFPTDIRLIDRARHISSKMEEMMGEHDDEKMYNRFADALAAAVRACFSGMGDGVQCESIGQAESAC